MGLLSGAKNKKIIAIVEIALIGKDMVDGIRWNSTSLAMHREMSIDPSHNFLEYALPFTIMASSVPPIFIR
jgi:hypothetical protein